jgi:hypothetical protein
LAHFTSFPARPTSRFSPARWHAGPGGSHRVCGVGVRAWLSYHWLMGPTSSFSRASTHFSAMWGRIIRPPSTSHRRVCRTDPPPRISLRPSISYFPDPINVARGRLRFPPWPYRFRFVESCGYRRERKRNDGAAAGKLEPRHCWGLDDCTAGVDGGPRSFLCHRWRRGTLWPPEFLTIPAAPPWNLLAP